MPVIASVNLKGGVGKTSVVVHLSGTLAGLGRRVLIVDADPQSSATAGYLGAMPTRQIDPASTIAAILAGDEPHPEQVIRPTGFNGIDLLPGSRFAAAHNTPEPHRADYERQVRLRDFLAEVHADYDVTLVDCPPNLHLASWSAMTAAEYVLTPVQAEDFGAQGLLDVAESMAMVRSTLNPGLAWLGLVLSMFNARRALHKAYETMIREQYGSLVFEATVPVSPDYPEAIAARKPVGVHKPRGAASKAIRALADELLARLDHPNSSPATLERGAA